MEGEKATSSKIKHARSNGLPLLPRIFGGWSNQSKPSAQLGPGAPILQMCNLHFRIKD